MRLKSIFAISFLSLMLPVAASAQSFYDDDIYYNPEKAKKEQEKKAQEQKKKTEKALSAAKQSWSYSSTSQPLPGSDTYIIDTQDSRDVDEYNRRYTTETPDTLPQEENFTYTRRIERFYNPDIITGSNNQELKEIYDYAVNEAAPNATTVNIYFNDYAYNPYRWYGPSSRWYWDYWGPGWSMAWGPSWSWGWDPYWNIGWGPAWAWGPSWGWGMSWGWGGYYPPVHYPAYIPPRQPAGGMGSVRPGNGRYNNAATAPSYGGRRPGATAGRIPGAGTPSSTDRNNNTGTVSGRRPGANNSVSNSNQSYRDRGTENRNNNNSNWNSNSSNSGRPGAGFNSGSFGGGNRGGFGGGGRGTGGRRR